MLSATNQALHSSSSQSEDNIVILYVKEGGRRSKVLTRKVRWRFKQGLISSLTSAFHPKENSFCCYECAVSLMYLGGRRLFATDHLYPSSPGASHHLQHTSHSIRLKVECTHRPPHTHKRRLQLLHLITFPFLASRRTPPDPRPPRPPACPVLPHFVSPLLPCSCTLLPLSFPGSRMAVCDEWDNITLVLCWPGLTAAAHLPPICLSEPPVCPSLVTMSGRA